MASRRNNMWLAPDSYVFHLGRDDWLHAVNANLMGFSERFLFASAYPLNALKPQLERFRKLAWNDDALPKLFYANAIAALESTLRRQLCFAPSRRIVGSPGRWESRCSCRRRSESSLVKSPITRCGAPADSNGWRGAPSL